MNTNHEVISAFLDDEPFEPQALGDALADPSGRELLIDCLLLRHVVQAEDLPAVSPSASKVRSTRALYLAASAAVLVALLGGYQFGQRRAADEPGPPAPTRIVQSEPVWQELGGAK